MFCRCISKKYSIHGQLNLGLCQSTIPQTLHRRSGEIHSQPCGFSAPQAEGSPGEALQSVTRARPEGQQTSKASVAGINKRLGGPTERAGLEKSPNPNNKRLLNYIKGRKSASEPVKCFRRLRQSTEQRCEPHIRGSDFVLHSFLGKH